MDFVRSGDTVEALGGTGGGGTGLWAVAIFFFVIFALLLACRRNEHGVDAYALGRRNEDSCADKLTWARYANFVDPELTRNHIDQCRDTGQIRKDLAEDNGLIQREIDKQTCTLQMTTKDVEYQLSRQNDQTRYDLARQGDHNLFELTRQGDQTRYELARQADQNMYAQEMARMATELQNKRDDINRLEFKLGMEQQARYTDQQFCGLRAQIAEFSCSTPKRPDFHPYGGVASTTYCGLVPSFNPCAATTTTPAAG